MTFQKIKVLETIRQGQIGGGESHVLDLVKGLNKEIFEPIVLSFTHGPMVDQFLKMGIKTHVIETLKPFNISTYNAVKNILIKEDIDILHAHGTRALSNTLFPAKSLGIPVAYTVHGWSFHQDQSFVVRKTRELSEKYLTNQVDRTISVSNSNQRDGLDRFNMQRSQVINYGIDLNRFNAQNKLKDLRAELGIQEGKTVVGFLVRMTIQKDPFTLIKAIAEVAKETRDVQFLFIGDGDLKQQSIEMAEQLGVRDMVTFHPFRSDVPEVLNTFDIYTLPSLWEGLPIGMLEAMAMSSAIIATPVDGSKEAIQHEQNGLLVPCKDYKALASSILKLHFNPSLRKTYGDAARKTVEDRFDLKMMIKNNEDLYHTLLPQKMIAA